jgi:outer membrane protein, heavy metal efflux system
MIKLLMLLSVGLVATGLKAQETNRAAGATVPASRPMPAQLSRSQAVSEALAHNPAIMAASEQVAEAKAGIATATAWPDPSLVAEVDQEKNFLDPRSGSEQDVGVQFTVPYPYRTHLNKKIARATWQQSIYTLTQLRQQTAFQTAQAYDAILVALRHRDDLTQSREMSRQFLEKTEARFRAGTVPRLDVLKAKVDLSKAENDLIANERAIATSRAGLNKLLGRPLGGTVEPVDSLMVPAPIPDREAVEQLALKSRPELLSMSVQQQAAHDSTVLAKQYWAPDVNLTLWYSQIEGGPNAYKFDGGITLPLFFWQHQQGPIKQAEHHETELKATGSDLLGQVLLDVRTTHTAADTAWRQAKYLRDELLPEANAAYQAVFASYGLGGSSALDLLDAKSSLLDAQSQYTDALGMVNDSLADLERAVGTLLPPAIPPSAHEK